MPERDLVFFSYNHEDGRWLAPLRGALEPYVLDEKLKVWSDRDIETGQRWDAEIQQALERTRVGVLLLSQRFFASKYIREKELPRIVECAEKGALILICVPVADFDPELLRQWNLHAYQFPLEPEDPLNARRASRRERAVVKIAIDVKEAYRRSGDIGSADVPRGEPRYRSAEPLPRAGVESSQRSQSAAMGGLLGVPDLDQQHYVERSDALTRLKELILEGHNLAAGVVSTHRAGRIGLHGMGGMGKTVLAQAFCHDESVRRTFPDGIYWLTLGQEPALLAKQTELLKMIDAQAPFPESAAQAKALLRDRLSDKRALLVIDDLWRAEHFYPFDVLGGQCRLVITTRDASLLTLIGAREEVLGQFDLSQSLQLIAEWVGQDVNSLPAEAEQVAKLCGRLPLALALAGAQIADGVQWSTLIEQLEQGQIEFLDHDYRSVFKSLGLSVDALEESERARYLELAVFPEDTRIPVRTIVYLWEHSGGMSSPDTEKLLGRFHRKALLAHVRAGGDAHVSFHDLQHDFLQMRADDPQRRSALLLDAYATMLPHSNGATRWSALSRDDQYMWRRVAAHMAEAERTDELQNLLLDINWIQAKLTASTTDRATADVNALLSDYDYLPDVDALALVCAALRMSSHVIGPNPEQVSFQLFGRLATSSSQIVRQLCRNAITSRRTSLMPMRPALSAPGALMLTLVGHDGPVTGATLIADDRRALSWSRDGILKVWDLERGEALHSLRSHEHAVNGAMLIADGRRAVSWSYDGTLQVWDLERGEALHTLNGHDDSVNGATLIADGRRALSWSDDRTLKTWDLERGEALRTLLGHQDSVNGATLLANSQRALSWSDDSTLKVWDLERGQPIHTLTGHQRSVSGAMLLADCRALSWSLDRTLKVWELERGETLHTLTGHEDWVQGATLLPDRQRALSWSLDCTLRVWDLQRGQVLHTLRDHGGAVNGATLLPGGRSALSWALDCTLKVWDLDRGELLRTLAGHESMVKGAALFPHDARALSWSYDRTLKLWDLKRDEPLQTLRGHEDWVNGATLLADGRRAMSWSDDHTLRLWDLERGQSLHALKPHQDAVIGAALLADGRRGLSWSRDRTLRIWDLDRDQSLHILTDHKGSVEGVTLFADGRRALSWAFDRSLKVWDLDRGNVLHTLTGHESGVKGATLLPGARRALSWADSHTLLVWNLKRGESSHTLIGHEGSVNGAALFDNGRRALSWAEDRTLRVWDLERGQAVHTLAGHEGSDNGARVLADGRRALSWSDDRTLRVWDIERGQALHTLTGHQRGVNGATLLADGGRALSWSDDRTLRVWDLAHGRSLHTLTGHQRAVNGAVVLPDGRRALSWSRDRTLKVWDLERGEAVHTITGHDDSVSGATLLVDGGIALSWSNDRTLRLIDLDAGVFISTYFADAALCTPAVDEARGRIFVGDALGHIHIIGLNTSAQNLQNM